MTATNASAASARSIAETFGRAWMSGDTETALGLVADDVVCDAPSGRIEGLPGYRTFLEGFLPMLTSATITEVFGDETSAAIVYTTDTTFVSDLRASDYLTIENGKITYVQTVFDRLPITEARRAQQG
ncbi:nuclear transport factor 2 family protein [Streptomyces sp. RTd22]|uniref:nuclear transport factor 2 family protein n=1 Tax=Streptomyces sp. RTd22 TaxID=1841249 RepID=UPI0007C4389E|nr:nuclear transport factor 2 family protein [Streptomyces sp. RTd22]